MKQKLNRILLILENIAVTLSATALFLMMLSISFDAFGRYFLHKPLQGQYEFTTLYLMVILTFLGMPKIQAIGGHISAPLLTDLLARIPGRPVERVMALMTAAIFVYMAYQCGKEAAHKIAVLSKTFGAIQFPTYLSYVWVPIGLGLTAARLAYQVVWPPEPHAEDDF